MWDNFWSKIDGSTQYKLLVSGHGKEHLKEVATDIFAQAEKNRENGVLELGLDMYLAAWEASPLDGSLANSLIGFNNQINFLPNELEKILHTVLKEFKLPSNLNFLKRLIAKDDKQKLFEYLKDSYEKDRNLFWLNNLLDLGYLLGKFDDLESLIKEVKDPYLISVLNKHLGDINFCKGEYELADKAYTNSNFISGESLLRSAESKFRQGSFDEACVLWKARLADRPWQINTWLKVHDLFLPPAPSVIDGKIAICVYSYKKPAEVDLTLNALINDIDPNVTIFALDNGSHDETEVVFRKYKDQMGDKFKHISLPINIGAPAARNWLKNLEEIRSFDYIGYLDDDALVPVDWQKKMSFAIREYPDAGVWGCKVVNNLGKEVIQHADIHLKASAIELSPDYREFNFTYFDSYNQDLDFGQFDYCRPCTSVTGCFHLFAKDVFLGNDDFDIRFSPSQYDDVEHDIMLASKGYKAVYQGDLSVAHMRNTGAEVLSSSVKGSGAANRIKLESKYTKKQIDNVISNDFEIILQDFGRKSLRVAEQLKINS